MLELENLKPLKYVGNIQPNEADQKRYKLQPYLPDEDLIDAVNLAIELGRPLLLRGEPGCGKSRLAQAVAYEFGQRYKPERKEDEFPWPFEFWPVKSTSRARDGLYIFDAVSRLRDAQLAVARHMGSDPESAEEARRRFEDTEQYIQLGQLGLAFTNNLRTVVLIDEIDKADIDFPNDLLIELDERRFLIEELVQDGQKQPTEDKDDPKDGKNKTERRIKHKNGWVEAMSKPIVIITSNAEKELPDAFLRRCVFHYIDFPRTALLHRIVCAHFFPDVVCSEEGLGADPPDGLSQEESELIMFAVKRFEWLREQLENSNAPKLTSTSELLDWLRVLTEWHKPASAAFKFLKESERLPYISVLLKNKDDQRRYGRQKIQENDQLG